MRSPHLVRSLRRRAACTSKTSILASFHPGLSTLDSLAACLSIPRSCNSHYPHSPTPSASADMKLCSRAMLLWSSVLATALFEGAWAGCGTGPTVSRNEGGTQTIVVGGTTRSYLVSVPLSYDPSKPSPLILSFHGAGKTPTSQRDLDQLTNAAFNTDHIVVYPQGINVGSSSTSTNLRFSFPLLANVSRARFHRTTGKGRRTSKPTT